MEFSLDDTRLIPFMTVSYTWGSIHSDERLNLNGHDVPILQSVAPLLHMLSSNSCPDFDSRHDYLWLDSICINQRNDGERASQVKLMRKIYGQASQTLVWLGEQSDDTDQAIDFLITLGQRRREFRHAARKRTMRIPTELEHNPGWDSLDRLLQNPWWRRVWTLQEFLIPEELTFYCGRKSLSRQAFRQGMDALELCGRVKSSAKSAWNRRRISDWYSKDDSRDKMSLVSLMAFCGDYEVTDPRDRVWGLHGLAREEDRRMIGHPTYAYDLETLYTGLVRGFVETHNSLDIICFSHLFSSLQPGWPSWVPDWRVPVQPRVVPLMVSQSANEHLANFRPVSTKNKQTAAYKASGDELPRIKCDVYRRLSCQGLVIDVIDGLCSAQRGLLSTVESTSPVNTQPGNAKEREALLQSLARSLVLNRVDKFLEQRAAGGKQDAIDLVLLVTACADLEGPDDRGFFWWFFRWWQARQCPALRIRGFTLEEICTMNRQPAGASRRESEPRKSFFTRLKNTMTGGHRRIMVTDLGDIGLAPRMAQKGDVVCVLFGCSVPVVLRRLGQDGIQGQDGPVFKFVGECYLDGFMDGEALGLGRQTHNFVMI